jgi:hypothetical protein
MSTRYSLPARTPRSDTDTARSARTLAAVVLVVTVMLLTLAATLVPPADSGLAAGEDSSMPAAPATVPGA